MALYLGTIVVAVLVVVATKGSFRRLGRIEINKLGLLLGALVLQIALEFVPFPKARIDDVGFALLMLSYVLILAFCWANRRATGFLIVAIGVALNMLVIGVNQGMPTKDEIVTRGGREIEVPIERSVKHRPVEPDDELVFLSDQITLGIANQYISIGDIVIGFGIVVVCFEASRRPRRFGVYLDRVTTASG